MDSTLLDQVRHLCRDRASYEHLKAILVQQERVHQLSHEEQYAKLTSTSLLDTRGSDTQTSNIFSNIIAREKALAQLADAIQRSPSLELVLQIAVQVAQKLLQVDRVAIFRRHPDGRGEFVTDAIATGLKSLADMPERQLSLARHMIEFTQVGNSTHSAQIIDSIRSSSFSTHIVNLLEQIGISSYAANKIYAGQEVWGTLVAFHGSAYHSWSESDRTSLSLVSAQVGIAISLTNLRQQSQELTNDLQVLQIELDDLQQTVVEIAKNATKPSIKPAIESDITTIDEQIIQDLIEDQRNDDLKSDNLKSEDLEAEINEVDQDLNDLVDQDLEQVTGELESELEEDPELSKDENIDFDLNDSFVSIVENHNLELSELEIDQIELDELKTLDKVATIESESFDFIALEQLAIATEISQSEIIDSESDEPQEADLEFIEPDIEPEFIELLISELVDADVINSDLETFEPDIEQDSDVISPDIDIEPELIEPELIEPEFLELPISELVNSDAISSDSETFESAVEPIQNHPANQLVNLELSQLEELEEELDPAIEPQFIETILAIAGNDAKANIFLLNVIDSYLEETPQLVRAMEKAIAHKGYLRLTQLLDSLRSSSDYIGALPLSYQCRQLESAVKANDVVLIYVNLSKVAIEAQRVTEALRIERSHYVI